MIKILLPIVVLASLGTFLYLNYQEETPKNKLQIIAEEINSLNLSWKAEPRVNFVYHDKRMFNLKIDPIPKNFDPTPVHKVTLEKLPKHFDAREQWPTCDSIKLIRDQSACGSCWAFGAAEAMSDRVCIASKGKVQKLISTEDLMECCDSCGDGCNGGWLYESWSYFKETGLSTGGLYQDEETCKPYEFPPCAHHMDSKKYDSCSKYDYQSPSCRNKCTSPSYKKKYEKDKVRGSQVYQVTGE